MRRDPNTLDLTQQTLRLAPDLRIWPVRQQGEWSYRIEIPTLHRFFQIGYEEYVLISLLDGQTTLPQACGLAAARLGSRAPTAARAATILRWLLRNELAFLPGDGPPQRRVGGAPHTTTSPLSRWNPFWIKLPLPRGEQALMAIARRLSPVLSGPTVAIGVVIMIAAVLLMLVRDGDAAVWSTAVLHPHNWLWLAICWIVLKAVHELAHAIACCRQGAEVRQCGLVWVLLAPLAYVDVSSCWRIRCKWARIRVAAAGMYVELLIAAIAALLSMLVVDSPHAKFLLHNVMLTAGVSTVVFNANVLMRFDGYFMLADFVEIPNLAGEATAAVRRSLRRVLIGETSATGTLQGWRRGFVLVLGIAMAIWRIVVCVSLAIACSVMFAGAGLVVAAIGIGLWVAVPAMQLRRVAEELRLQSPDRLLRAATLSVIAVAALMAIVFWLPIPTALRVPAVVQYRPDTMLRSGADGKVVAIHVRDGDWVQAGQLLMELENHELAARLDQLDIRWQQNTIRLRQAMEQHDDAARRILQQNQHALNQQMDNLRRQLATLRLVAPRSGQVVARNLIERLGCHVGEGDPLLTLSTAAEKEIVALVHQRSIAQVRNQLGQPVSVRTADRRRCGGQLDRIEPRASDRLNELALAATAGGPLAVQDEPAKNKSNESLRLLEPHFRARIELAAADAVRLPAGMRVDVAVGYRSDPLATRIATAVRQQWHDAQTAAR